MINRTSLKKIEKKLNENKNWKVLDIGCGYTANKFATTIADVLDLQEFYKGKNFVKIENKKLPFEDNTFDFVIASHVIEHIEDISFFLKEIQRISNKGYIELPTRLGDNLVFENQKEHLWWFTFDDQNKILIAEKKKQILEPFMSVATAKQVSDNFRESFVLELYWENNIEYNIKSEEDKKYEQLTFFTIIKKFFSKKLRRLIKG